MSKKSNQEFREEFIRYVNGYFNVPNYLSDIVQPHIKSSTWDVFTAIWRRTIGNQKWEARISISLLCTITGLGGTTVITATAELQSLGIIEVQKQVLGMGKKGGRSRNQEMIQKHGGSSNLIRVCLEALYFLKRLEEEPLQNLKRLDGVPVQKVKWYLFKNYRGRGTKPLQNLKRLKTINKNNKNREDFSLSDKKQKEEFQTEGAKVLRDFLNKIGKGLNRNSQSVSLLDVEDTKEQKNESE